MAKLQTRAAIENLKQSKSVVALKSTTAGKAPKEIRIFKWGENETVHGTFELTEEGAANVLETFKAYGNALTIDYEHATFGAPSGPAPAAGWIEQGDLFVKDGEDGGLFAKVEWTETAAKMIEAKEYRYFSPTFAHDDDGQILALLPMGLVNFPGTIGMDPLIAAKALKRPVIDHRTKVTRLDRLAGEIDAPSFEDIRNACQRALDAWTNADPARRYGWISEVFDSSFVFQLGSELYRVDYSIDAEGAATIGDPVEVIRVYQDAPPDSGEAEGTTTMAKALTLTALSIFSTIGFAPSDATTDVEATSHLTKLRAMKDDVLKLTGCTDLDEARGALTALAKEASEGKSAIVKLAALEVSSLETQEKAILDELVKDMKMTPAEAEELAARPGAKTEAGVKWLKGFATKLTAKTANGKTGEGETKPGDVKHDASTSGLTVESVIAKMPAGQKRRVLASGVKLEDWAKTHIRRTEEDKGRKRSRDDDEEDDTTEA